MSSAAHRRTTIAGLPEDLLAACLEPLDIEERCPTLPVCCARGPCPGFLHAIIQTDLLSSTGRLCSACLVSKQFYRASNVPWLRNGAVQLLGVGTPARQVHRAQALAQWLAGCGSNVRTLLLGQHEMDAAPALQQCTAACQQLQELHGDGTWLASLAWLPPSLTSLYLDTASDFGSCGQLGHLLGHLANLQHLTVQDADYAGRTASLAGLAASLTHLALINRRLPARLEQLTALQKLHIADSLASVDRLAGMPRLRECRVFGFPAADDDGWPATLAHKQAFFGWAAEHPALQRLQFYHDEDDPSVDVHTAYAHASDLLQLWRARPQLHVEDWGPAEFLQEGCKDW
ncbi:hypothetical protein ABPG75_009220 [Micractinium tetrahymenae]